MAYDDDDLDGGLPPGGVPDPPPSSDTPSGAPPSSPAPAKDPVQIFHAPGELNVARKCSTTYVKAGSFEELIRLVEAAEAKLAAAGISAPKDQIHALRGIYYGTTWSTDFKEEKSTTRSDGFQRFTRPSEDSSATVPPDIRTTLDCNLFEALQQSQDAIDPSGRQVDFGHLIIGLDARFDPAMKNNCTFPYKTFLHDFDIDMGGTGTELVTWVGDLGGGTGSLSLKRGASSTVRASEVFVGSDYGGAINLEGDVAGYVVASTSSSGVTAPAAGKKLSDALREYLSPGAPSPAWKNRATTFLTMYGGTFDGSGALSNRSAVITTFATKIQTFACNYLASRVGDKRITADNAKAAAVNVIPCAQEVASAFVDALVDSRATGGPIKATRFPSPLPASSSTCGTQLFVANLLGL